MGTSHAKAYQAHEGFEIAGLVSRSEKSRNALSELLGGVATYPDFDSAVKDTAPDAISINTYPDTHAEFARKSLQHGCHVFIEKPLATTVQEAESLVALANDAVDV